MDDRGREGERKAAASNRPAIQGCTGSFERLHGGVDERKKVNKYDSSGLEWAGKCRKSKDGADLRKLEGLRPTPIRKSPFLRSSLSLPIVFIHMINVLAVRSRAAAST